LSKNVFNVVGDFFQRAEAQESARALDRVHSAEDAGEEVRIIRLSRPTISRSSRSRFSLLSITNSLMISVSSIAVVAQLVDWKPESLKNL